MGVQTCPKHPTKPFFALSSSVRLQCVRYLTHMLSRETAVIGVVILTIVEVNVVWGINV